MLRPPRWPAVSQCVASLNLGWLWFSCFILRLQLFLFVFLLLDVAKAQNNMKQHSCVETSRRRKNSKKLPKGRSLAYHRETYIGCIATTVLSGRNHRVPSLWTLQRCVSSLQRVPSSKTLSVWLRRNLLKATWKKIKKRKEKKKTSLQKCRKHSERFRCAAGIVTILPNLEHIFSFFLQKENRCLLEGGKGVKMPGLKFTSDACFKRAVSTGPDKQFGVKPLIIEPVKQSRNTKTHQRVGGNDGETQSLFTDYSWQK